MNSTEELSQLSSSIRDFTPEQLGEVLKLRNRTLSSTTWPLFTTNHAIFLIGLYVMSRICERIIKYYQPKISLLHLKNCTTYILEIFWTFVILLLQLISYRLFVRDFNFYDFQITQILCLILIDLYIFELFYRPMMRLPLAIHHLTTISLIIFAVYIIEEAKNLDLVPIGLILYFQASTEQSTFLGLLFYRLKPSWASPVLFFAAIQVFIVKFSMLIWFYVFWGKHVLPNEDGQPLVKAANVVFPIGGFILFGTQLWSTYVVWKIANQARQNQNQQNGNEKKLEEGSASNRASTIRVDEPDQNA